MFHLRACFHVSAKLYRQPVANCIINRRQLFRTDVVTVSKTSVGCENKFAHAVLEINPQCRVLRGEQNDKNDVASVAIDFDQNWRDLTTTGVVEWLETIKNYCKQNGTTISDEKFDEFVDVCTDRCFDFTDSQLIQSLQILHRYPLTESPKSRNFVELWNALDDACVERIDAWDFNTILYVCDHWHMLQLGRFNKFSFRGCLKIGRKLRRLPPHQLVQLMFYLSIRRVEILDMFEIEINLGNSLDAFSLDEIAVLCMGFFKTQTKFKDQELVEKIFKRTIREIDTVDDLAFTCILKALRYSLKNFHHALVLEMLNAADGQLARLSTLTCLHVALLGTHLHICHQSCIEQILHRFADDVQAIRMKDLERISYVMGFFDFESESNIANRLCQQFLAELKNRVDDIVRYPKCFALSLHYLSLKGYHDEEMISVALSPSFLSAAYGNQTRYDNELFGLDSFVKINLKETYTGNQLTEKNRQYMGKMLTEYVPDRNKEFKIGFADNLLLEVKETSDELCTHSYFAHSLPHFSKPDIIIAYDRNSNTGIDIAHKLPPLYTGKIIDRSMLVDGLDTDAADVEIVNVIVGGWSSYIRGTEKVNGFNRQKIEQAKMLGLRPVLIPWFDWKRLLRWERKMYIERKIKEALQVK
ncbi:uncharacterized protein LOC119083781 [Bradysia coprophila]|uniref:uncharacterized protein LOC119083781 n=1 Tax=Bradysia coprophila TaxID=38358 RepID=UPI00187DCD2A|nr:uncharacterized protein LOC119083781 [Bradysia coprophila]